MENDNVKFKILIFLFARPVTKFILLFGVILIFTFSIFNYTNAATNIDATYKWAWNDTIGWIDFYSTGNVNVTSTQLTGYASSSVGYIALDCATSPSPDCTYSYKVSNDGNGNLSGWAWNDAIGWISFASSSPTYQVTINTASGDFSGWAWNDIVGWISFNCLDINNCATSPNHKVKTNWRSVSASSTLTSSIFDTGVSSGVAINTIMWQGNKPSGTSVKFQIASNNILVGGGTGSIDSTYRYAWNDSIGWLDFGYPAGNVNVGETQLTGYAYNDDVLEIALDCATSPAGNICISQSNFKVSRNPSTGDLSGWAWNDSIGWISFNCFDPGLCGSSDYKVNVNPTTGAFTGYAWNDYVGWISFNCSNPGLCGSSDYRVNTSLFVGWDYFGPDGSNTTYYTPTDANMPVQINLAQHNNKRYFRYKIFLESNVSQTLSPRVDDVIINYSP